MKVSVVLIALQDSQGNDWLQQRAHDHEDYPSCWDFAAGGGVDDGEDVDSAALRELKEVLGIKCDLHAGETLWLVDEYCQLYHGIYDGDFQPNHEVASMQLLPRSRLQDIPVTRLHPQLAHWLDLVSTGNSQHN